MTWQGLSEADLWDKLNQGWDNMTFEQRRAWEAIRIPPEKWALPPWGDHGGGFWVVALIGRRAIWYNDIEEGFNRSRYERYGTISDYYCNQDELEMVIYAVLRLVREGDDPGPFLGPPQPGEFPG